MRKLSIVVALAFACSANAQQFDGTWTGSIGQWTLTVKGSKARLEMVCARGYQGMSDFNLGADGKVSTYVSLPQVAGAREQVTGTVQALQITNGPCGGGTATMTKKS